VLVAENDLAVPIVDCNMYFAKVLQKFAALVDNFELQRLAYNFEVHRAYNFEQQRGYNFEPQELADNFERQWLVILSVDMEAVVVSDHFGFDFPVCTDFDYVRFVVHADCKWHFD